jgi:hypothetical protein
VWPHLKSLNLNTVFTPISWRQFEPREGEFDYTLLEGQIRQARAHGLRLALLWFGAWKNGVSGYAPAWVLTNPVRFPRMTPAALSPRGEHTLEAESRAFRALMRRLRETDSAENTVLMVQVENEVGTKPGLDLAGTVPPELLRNLAANESQLKPVLRDLWTRNGRRTGGTWREVFGAGPEAEDVSHAWYYASYIGRLAAAGKREYPLPMFVNACQLRGEAYQPGQDPAGGPTDGVLDIWMAAAPAIDVFAVDNYQNFKPTCSRYRHRGNPLFMPESCHWFRDDPYSGPAKAFYSFGEHHALAFSPFGIDNRMYADHLLSLAYRKLAGLAPMILEHRGTPRLRGFYRAAPEEKGETFTFDHYRATLTYRTPARPGPDRYGSFGLIIQTAADEFMVAGRGFTLRFEALSGTAVNLGVEEGNFAGGEWRVRRHLSGDEVGGQGAETVLTPAPFSAQPVIGEEEITILKLRMARL